MVLKMRGVIKTACRLPLLSLLLLAACETVRNADIAKMEVLPAADPVLAKSAERVVLTGFDLADFVDFALTNRPEVISAELAVEDRLMAIRTVESAKPFMPHLTMSANYGQSTANSGSRFSWRNSGRFNGGIGMEMRISAGMMRTSVRHARI